MRTLDETVNGLDLLLIEETEIPRDDRGTNQNKHRKRADPLTEEVQRIVDEFESSDMQIASVQIPSYIEELKTFRIYQKLYTMGKHNGIKVCKRDRRIYLSKVKEN